MKNFGERGAWAYPETAQIFWVPPIISGTGKATNFKFGRCIQSVHANKSPLIIWEKRERWRIQGLSKFLKYPLLFQERVKLRTSNFVRTFVVSIGAKPITNFGKSSRGLVRTLEIFWGTHILGASRGRLCDSSAFLYLFYFFCHPSFSGLHLIMHRTIGLP